MLGREVLLPSTLIAAPPQEPVSVPFVADFRNLMRDAHSRVRRATRSAASSQKTYFDQRVRGIQFTLGQLVWLYWPWPKIRQQQRKLQRLWTGPWRITNSDPTSW